MADKLREYQGFYGQLHQMKDKGKEKVENWRESHPEGINRCVKNVFKIDRYSREPQRECPLDEYSHVYRLVKRLIQLIFLIKMSLEHANNYFMHYTPNFF